MNKMKSCLIILSFAFLGIFAEGQTHSDDVLFSVDGEPVMATEFVRVYSKNLDLVQDERQKDIDEYLKLFVNYKLKIKEATALGFDEKPSYVREFNNYKKQLARNYLTDHEVTEALVKEAYDRISYDVKVSHILIRLSEYEKDTAEVYNRMLAFKKRLEAEDFESLKSEISDGSNIIAEDLGYFSGFKMVYPFETVAYNTPVGKVSQPFRTRFGYHILKVFDKRKSRGEVTVGHIMVKHNQNDSTVNPDQRIQEIYKMIKTPEDFESLARQFSDDPSSAKKGGKLPSFKSGQLSSTEFEDVAFGLTEIGEIAAPFKTQYGWHIVRLYDKKPTAPYEELAAELTQKVKRDSRSQVITAAFVAKLKKQYNVNSNVDLSYFVSILNDNFFTKTWEIPSDLTKDKLLLKVGDMPLTYLHFAEHLRNAQKRNREKMDLGILVDTEFEEFLKDKIFQYHEDNLESVNEEYAHVVAEYRDGLLLFDLMETKVWNAVKEDTLALQKFYEKNKNNYNWPERIDAIVVSGSEQDYLNKVQDALKSNVTADELKAQFNSGDNQNIIVTTGKFTKDSQVLPEKFKFVKGVSSVYNHNNAFHVVRVDEVLPQSQKTFEECMGNVISDYQQEYEKEWMQSLREKYKVEVNEDVLNKIKIQLSN